MPARPDFQTGVLISRESSAEYYRLINTPARERLGGHATPRRRSFSRWNNGPGGNQCFT